MAKPALEPAHPSGAVAGTYQPVDHALTEVLMDDGTWQHAEVLGEARDIRRRWRVLLLWYAPGTQREDWFMFDPAKLRRVTEDLQTRCALRWWHGMRRCACMSGRSRRPDRW